MIKKIISSGRTGADRAALDAAIQLGISHGGWTTMGTKTKDSDIHRKYQLQEMPTSSCPTYAEKNTTDSDGTLIFFRGNPTSGIKFVRMMALQHEKHLLHIDLNIVTSHDAASLIRLWIRFQNINILNVAGPSALKDGEIYGEVLRILKMAIATGSSEEEKPSYQSYTRKNIKPLMPPRTVEEAVERLIKELTLRDRTTLAYMAESELSTLYLTLGDYIRREFGLGSGNGDLMTSCGFFAKGDKVHQDEALSIIIREVWKQLGKTYRLRAVK